MYPLADVPVLQLRMPTHDPARLLDIGGRLRPLREEGVLVIGSGFMTHGLPFLDPGDAPTGRCPAWSSDFDAWVADALARGDVDELAAYRDTGPGMPYAHPTAGALHPAVRHPRRRHRSRATGADHHRRLHDGPLQALLPGRLSTATNRSSERFPERTTA